MKAELTLQRAKLENRCRICGDAIQVITTAPKGWKEEFGSRIFPNPAITLNFGKEFSHTECLEKEDK